MQYRPELSLKENLNKIRASIFCIWYTTSFKIVFPKIHIITQKSGYISIIISIISIIYRIWPPSFYAAQPYNPTALCFGSQGTTSPHAPNQAWNSSSQGGCQSGQGIIESLLFLVGGITCGVESLTENRPRVTTVTSPRSPEFASFCQDVWNMFEHFVSQVSRHFKGQHPLQWPVNVPHWSTAVVSFASAGINTSRTRGQRFPWWYWTAMATLATKKNVGHYPAVAKMVWEAQLLCEKCCWELWTSNLLS